jgi:hypothetical protein
MADIDPPTKHICLAASKGSVTNNPFRLLSSENMTIIKAMKSYKHSPTPTALLIKNLVFDRAEDNEALLVWTHPPEGDDNESEVSFSEPTLLSFQMDSDSYQRLEHSDEYMGRVISDLEVKLRRMQRNPAMSGTRELHSLFLMVQRERAEEQGTD